MTTAPAGPDQRWLRAAVLGSLWAAAEIVLGSFLHNLRVPLRGHLMTALGIALLAAGQRAWPQSGLLWRAGLLAAAMKSISPSAMLLGPMVAIAVEGSAMQAGTVLLGRRRAGIALGGALAMSWTFIHQIAGLLITYGADFARLYAGAVRAAERVVGDVPLGPWGPITALAALNLAAGAAAALAGWGAAGASGGASARPALATLPSPRHDARALRFRHNLGWLAFLTVLLPAGLFALGRLELPVAAVAVGAFTAACAWRYRGALRRLRRPGLWIGLLILTAASGFLLGPEGDRLAGVAAGAAMSLRAVFVIVCFAALSRELSHPRLVAWLERRGGGRFVAALELGFATLPVVLAALPPATELARHPRRALASLLPHLDVWVAAAANRAASPRPVHVIAGARGAGKSTLLAAVVERLRADGLAVAGVSAPGEVRDGARWSFEVVDLATGERRPLARRDGPQTWPAIGPFRVDPEGLAFARAALERAVSDAADIVAVDEVGPWELSGEGYAAQLDALRQARRPLLLVVREELIAAVGQRWAALRPTVWNAGTHDARTIAAGIVAELRAGR